MVTLFEISKLFGQAFINAATMKTALSAFQKPGIWPTNMNVFSDDDFLPAATTDISLTPADHQVIQNNETESAQATDVRPEDRTKTPEPRPGCSWMSDDALRTPVIKSPISSFPTACPADVVPVPKVLSGQKRTKRNRGKTAILTASPYKDELEEAQKSSEPKTKKTRENAKKNAKC